MTDAATNKTVLIYRRILLPYSNTFIAEQMRAYRRWRGILIGRRLLRELPLDGLDVRLLKRDRSSFPGRLHEKLLESLGRVHGIANLARERPRLLHAHFGTDAVEAAPYARALGIPLAVTLHGYDINIHREWWEAGHGGSRMRTYPERLLKLAHEPLVHFIAVSNAIRERAVEYGIPKEKLTVCYIGVDTKRFAPAGRPVAERDPRVLFIGRLVEKKGCRYLIDAMAEVRRSVPDARLIVIGDGPERAELEDRARRLAVDATFRGAQPAAEVKRELDLARVFCLPSVTAENGDAEGLPISLLEAQSSGVPVVTSASSSTEAIHDKVSGFQCQRRDIGALSAHLITLLSDDRTAARMGCAARELVSKRFDILSRTAALELTMDEMLEAFGSGQLRPRRTSASPSTVTRLGAANDRRFGS